MSCGHFKIDGFQLWNKFINLINHVKFDLVKSFTKKDEKTGFLSPCPLFLCWGGCLLCCDYKTACSLSLVAPIDCRKFTRMVCQKDPKNRASEDPNASSSDSDAEGEQRRQELRRENQLLREGIMYLFAAKSGHFLPQTYLTFLHRGCGCSKTGRRRSS